MLADPRADALVTNFAGQWLYLRNIETVRRTRGVSRFRREPPGGAAEGDGAVLREHAPRGPQRSRSAAADYTFLNERLARHYGIPDIHGTSSGASR